MRKQIVYLVAVLAIAAVPAVAQQWHEDFESYSPGPLAAQSLWEEWDGSSGVDALVDQAFAFSGSNAVLIQTGSPGNDVVWRYANGPGGQPGLGLWIATIKTYVSSNASGTGWYIMLNRYRINGGSKRWSLQVQFDADNNLVIGNDLPGTPSVALIEDQWVTLRVIIDITGNRFDLTYGDQYISDPATGDQWFKPGTDDPAIAAIDLYAGEDTDPGISDMYYDDPMLWKIEGVTNTRGVVLDALPNPALSGDTIKLTTMSPELAGQPGALFLFSVNGVPFFTPIFFFNLDGTGRFQLPGPVPPGLAGLDLQFVSYVLIPTSGVSQSPFELVQMR